MQILSLLTPADVEELNEIPGIGICGKFDDHNTRPEDFRENPGFIDFMHHIIKSKGHTLKSIQEAATRQQFGYLYIIDLRTPGGVMGDVPSEDIIGAFKINEGLIIEEGYFRNDRHKIYTSNGLVKLPPELHDLIIDEIKATSKPGKN